MDPVRIFALSYWHAAGYDQENLGADECSMFEAALEDTFHRHDELIPLLASCEYGQFVNDVYELVNEMGETMTPDEIEREAQAELFDPKWEKAFLKGTITVHANGVDHVIPRSKLPHGGHSNLLTGDVAEQFFTNRGLHDVDVHEIQDEDRMEGDTALCTFYAYDIDYVNKCWLMPDGSVDYTTWN